MQRQDEINEQDRVCALQTEPELEQPAREAAGPSVREDILSCVATPIEAAHLALPSGRRVEIESGEQADLLTVRSPQGEVVLRVEVTDSGPVLRFRSAAIDVCAAERLELSGATVAIRSQGDLEVQCSGALREQVQGSRHTRVSGNVELEAAAVQMQANESSFAIRAAETIALDGEHIGLNDDPAPAPFPWSAIAESNHAATPGSADPSHTPPSPPAALRVFREPKEIL